MVETKNKQLLNPVLIIQTSETGWNDKNKSHATVPLNYECVCEQGSTAGGDSVLVRQGAGRLRLQQLCRNQEVVRRQRILDKAKTTAC